MVPPRLARASCILFITTLLGCLSDDGRLTRGGAHAAVEVGDSAGVRIVTLHGSVEPSSEWHLDPEPALAVGVATGDERYELSRVVGAVLRTDGLLIADGGSGQLRLYDLSGRHVKSVGGSGSGPGEFQQLRWMGSAGGERILAWDLPLAAQGSPTGLDTIIRLPARPSYMEPSGASERLPFTVDPGYAAGGSSVWAGSGQAGDINLYTKDGTLQLVLRFPLTRAVPDAAVDAYRASYVANHSGAELAERSRRVRDIPIPSALPAFDQIRLDTQGNLWVREYRVPADSGEQRWAIFSTEGDLLAFSIMPGGLRVLSVTHDHVVGVWRDELDVEQVRVYRYDRS